MKNNIYETPSDLKLTADVKLNPNNEYGIHITTGRKFFKRLWLYFSNPFTYIFTGKIRY